MKITLFNLPKLSTNKIYAGIHWRDRRDHKYDYTLLTNSMKKLAPIDQLVDLEFTFYFKKNAMDSSNCSYMGKLLEDCLVLHGVLKDDTIKFVRKVSYQSVKDKDERCEIEIKLL